jgi:MoaA/NifB/PqqE/SkfB family radical SAM enzyme
LHSIQAPTTDAELKTKNAQIRMNIYSLLRINRFIKNPFIKSLGIWILHILNRRYLAIFLDPVLACNLRCRMCYFSDDERRKTLKGQFSKEDLSRIAEVIFPQTLKLQIGCGAEPSLFKHNAEIIRLGKQYGVPYISYTTNANLLSLEEIDKLLDAGLDEFTISLHGVKKETYEDLMQGASYEKFLSVLAAISAAKTKYPKSKLRINFTVNEQNSSELANFFEVFADIKMDILQVRLVSDIGGEIRFIANPKKFNSEFNRLTIKLKNECARRGITYIALLHLDDNPKENKSSSIISTMYWYISPRTFGEGVDWRNETFRQYCKRTHYASRLFKNAFSMKRLSNDKLNYEII